MNRKLNRRQVLRGTGALITLPALESLGFRRFASAAPAGPPPKRMIFLGMGYGVTSETWFPNINDKGAGYKLPVGLKPLARHKKDFTIVQGCKHQFSRQAHWGSTYWLTGRTNTVRRANPFPTPFQPTRLPQPSSVRIRATPQSNWALMLMTGMGMVREIPLPGTDEGDLFRRGTPLWKPTSNFLRRTTYR